MENEKIAVAEAMAVRGREIQEIVADYSQEQVDSCVRAMCLAFRNHAAELAREAHEETGYGSEKTKTEKNLQAADAVWYALKGKRSVGIIGEDADKRLLLVGKPIGVIAAVTPSTNPSTTILFDAAYAVKGRNVVIFSPHPGAKNTSIHTIEILREALKRCGAPEDILQYSAVPCGETSQRLMELCDTSLIAADAKTVKKGYSSGKPCIGVSHGNVQTILDRGCDYAAAVADTVYSCRFDNGLICACNHAILVPEESKHEILRYLKQEKAAVLTEDGELAALRNTLFPAGGEFDRSLVGKNVQYIAKKAGLTVEEDASVLLAAPKSFADNDPLLAGGMVPLCLLLTYRELDDAIACAKRALQKDGAGHSIVVYSDDREKLARCAQKLPISRLLVNQRGVYAANQQLKNGLEPTANLACGSWANNSLSENVTYLHLMNICRIAWPLPEKEQPTHEEIWR